MDSLTQIVLGAAMGEAVAGRKIGNKAMLWGAIAGTIPDLDVFVGPILRWSAEDSLAFHRGITHSLLFAVLVPLLLAWYTSWLYGNGYHKRKNVKQATGAAGLLFMLFCGSIVGFIAYTAGGLISMSITLLVALLIIAGLSVLLNNSLMKGQQGDVFMSYGRWYLLFFLAVLTHPILDSCTGYGTQLLQPFSDLRVQWHNISVADPLYTLPFLLLLLLAATRGKHNKWRTILNYAGIAYSLLYLSWTLRNKYVVDQIFRDSLAKKEITYSRHLTTPTILNNLLWHCIAESDSVYYDGFYSLFDSKDEVELYEIQKNHELITMPDDKRAKIIKWFTNDYYGVMVYDKDTIQVNDLRYGPYIEGQTDSTTDYIFPFLLYPDGETGEYKLKDQSGPPEGSMEEMFTRLVDRVQGR